MHDQTTTGSQIDEVMQSAHAVEAAVRRLVQATLNARSDNRPSTRSDRTSEAMTPADIDTVLAHLAESVGAVPQIAAHVAGLLEQARSSFDLALDDMTVTTDPDLAVDTALLHLDALRHPAVLVLRRLDAARQETAHIRAEPSELELEVSSPAGRHARPAEDLPPPARHLPPSPHHSQHRSGPAR